MFFIREKMWFYLAWNVFLLQNLSIFTIFSPIDSFLSSFIQSISKKLHLFYNIILKREILFWNFFSKEKKESFQIVFLFLFMNRFDQFPSKTYLVFKSKSSSFFGMAGFEPAAFCSQSRHSTKLSYIPLYIWYFNQSFFFS